MYKDNSTIMGENDNIENRLKRYSMLQSEANTVRDQDKSFIKNLFKDFHNNQLKVGMGFQRSYGSILSGDYFDLLELPDGSFLFVFADISGHGLPAYTTLIRLKSAIVVAVDELYKNNGDSIDTDVLIDKITHNFTSIMDASHSSDFACVNFTFFYDMGDFFNLKFYNRGMIYPIIVRDIDNAGTAVIDLNEEFDGWKPDKGALLGSDMRMVLGKKYLYSPCCEFEFREGDSILFFSDGITEAHNVNRLEPDYGQKRIEDMLVTLKGMAPQLVVNEIFSSVYSFIGHPEMQLDDMSAVLIDFPVGKNIY